MWDIVTITYKIFYQYYFCVLLFISKRKACMTSLIFKHFLSKFFNIIKSVKSENKALEIKDTEKCLLLAPKTEDIFLGAGGTLLLNAQKFNVCTLTNGFKDIKDDNLSYEEKVNIRKNQFEEILGKTDVIYSEFFEDIDEGRLLLRYDRFQKLNISKYDYIFIPNITEQNKDSRAISILLNELLKEKPYRKNLKIVLYEITSTLPVINGYVDIEEVIDKKVELAQSSEIKIRLAQNIKNLNAYRGNILGRNYAEAFCIINVQDLNKLCKAL